MSLDKTLLDKLRKRSMNIANKESILWGHKRIHEGKNYYVKDFHEFNEEEEEIFDLLAIVRGPPEGFDSVDIPHVTWKFVCNRECTLELYEGTLITGEPTDGLENENNNRLIKPLPPPFNQSFFRSGYTITDLGHRMYRAKFGEVFIESHLETNRAEFIGTPNHDGKHYLFRFTKNSKQKGWLDYYITFYLQ